MPGATYHADASFNQEAAIAFLTDKTVRRIRGKITSEPSAFDSGAGAGDMTRVFNEDAGLIHGPGAA